MTQTKVAEAFNPYRTWLELDTDQPRSDYELLGLKPFEPNATTISAAADRAIARVRSHRPGAQAAAWSRLLDDLSAAKRRLGDEQQKLQYDETLRGGTARAEVPAATSSPAPASANDFRYPPGMSPGGVQPSKSAAQPAPAPFPVPAASGWSATSAPVLGATANPWSMPAQPAPLPAQPTPMLAQPAPLQPMPNGYAAAPNMYSYGTQAQPQMPVAFAMPVPAMPQPGMYPGTAPLAAPGWYQQPAQPPPPMSPQAPPTAYPMAALPVSGAIDPMAPAALLDPMAPIDPMSPFGQMPVASVAYGETAAMPMGVAVAAETSPSRGAEATFKGPSAAQAANSRSRSGADPVVWGGIMLAGVFVAAGVWFAMNNDNETVEIAKNTNRVTNQVERNNPPVGVNPVPSPKPWPKPVPAPTPLPNPKPPEPGPMPAPMPKPPEPAPMPKPPEPMPAPVPVPVPPTPPVPTPPEPAPKPEMPLPTKQEVTDLAKALQTAKLALSEGNVEDAKIQLEKAKSLPKLPEHEPLVQRMSMLVEYNDQFWNAIDEAMKSFKEGMNSELMVGSQVLLVVEPFPDKIILRIAGQNKTYALKDLPGGIAVAIADKWLNESDPASRVVKGAYAAVNKAGNVDKARIMWDEATAAGLDMKALMPVLEDKYDGLEKDLDKAMQARAAAEKPAEAPAEK